MFFLWKEEASIASQTGLNSLRSIQELESARAASHLIGHHILRMIYWQTHFIIMQFRNKRTKDTIALSIMSTVLVLICWGWSLEAGIILQPAELFWCPRLSGLAQFAQMLFYFFHLFKYPLTNVLPISLPTKKKKKISGQTEASQIQFSHFFARGLH